MIWLTLSFVSAVTCAGQSRLHKEKRLHKGGVGPEMRSPAGLINPIMDILSAGVKANLGHQVGGHV